MSWNSFTRKILAIVVAVVVVGSVSVSPVSASAQDDSLLSDDDGEEGGLLTNTTDSLTDTVDSTTGGTTEPVTEPVDSTVSTTEDTVSSTTGGATDSATEPVTDAVGAGDVSPPDDADELVAVTDGLGDGEVPADELPTDGSLPIEDLPDGTAPVPLTPEMLERQQFRTEDLPADESVVLAPVTDTLPTGEEAPVQPEDSPYGSEGSGLNDACALPVDENTLPVDTVPAPGDLPVQPDAPVPLGLLTPEAVAGIAFGIPPAPCEVYDPHDPSLDPTDPPTDPQSTVSLDTADVGTDGVRLGGYTGGQLEDDGFFGFDRGVAVVSDEHVATGEQLALEDGSTYHYLYVENNNRMAYRTQSGDSYTRLGVLGRHAVVDAECVSPDLANATVDPEDPLGPCEYSLGGVPSVPAGPETVVDAVENPPAPEEALPVGSLPGNAPTIINL